MKKTVLPSSEIDFLGKDGFHLVGDRYHIKRRWSGVLFTELVFPVRNYVETRNDNPDVRAILPAELGLNVQSRDTVGMEAYAGTGGSPYPSTRERLHREFFETPLTQYTAVVQAAGIIAVARNMELVEDICSKPAQQTLPDFVASLTELVAGLQV
jgi:hypothetical protein